MTTSRRHLLTAAAGTVAASALGTWLPSARASATATATATTPPSATTVAAAGELILGVAVGQPWMANQVALTSRNSLFLGMPRFPGHEDTPSVGRRDRDGTVRAFPGNSWNEWQEGDSGRDAFVYVNGLHIFADDTVWCVDQGALRPDASSPEASTPKPGAQKIVRLHPRSGRILDVLRFGDDILPPGAQMNDLRKHGSTLYITDSGIGALIVHDLSTGRTIRRLSGNPAMMAGEETTSASPGASAGSTTIPSATPSASTLATTPTPSASASSTASTGQHQVPKSDLIEVSDDGRWVYWGSPTGPIRRISAALLRDTRIDDTRLAEHIQYVADIPVTGGCAMDTLGNLYLSDIHNRRVLLLPPGGEAVVLASHPDLISPDGPFIGRDRRLYVPSTQAELTQLYGNPVDLTTQPFQIFSLRLPRTFAGIRLGDALI
jgi:sugar lactone lactonase YvrE